MKNPKVIGVQAQENYMLCVRFENGVTKMFDVKPLLSMPIYRPLEDACLFSKVSIDRFGGITWGNDIDCCCDTLYAHGINRQEKAG